MPPTGRTVPVSVSTRRTPYPPTSTRTPVRSASGCRLISGRYAVVPQAPADDGHGAVGAVGASTLVGDPSAAGVPGWSGRTTTYPPAATTARTPAASHTQRGGPERRGPPSSTSLTRPT